MANDQICKHCSERIVLIHYISGTRWMHQPAGAAFHDNANEHCRINVAEPKRDAIIYLTCSGGCGKEDGPFICANAFYCEECMRNVTN